MTWDSAIQDGDTNLHAAIARAILQAGPARNTLLQQTRHLCPVHLQDLPPSIVPVLRHAHTSTLEHLRRVEADVTSATPGTEQLDDDALLRLVVAMQMNAFESGVYVRLALVNHSCKPNCCKFTPAGSRCVASLCCPTANSFPFPVANVCGQPCFDVGVAVRRRSEIVATQDIAPGQEVFINYIQPFGQSEERRKLAFEEQHIWDLPPSPYGPECDALAEGAPQHGHPGFAEAMQEVAQLEEQLDSITEGMAVRSHQSS